MSLTNEVGKVFNRVGKDIRSIAERLGFLERELAYLTSKCSVERTDPDSEGIYRRITWRRPDHTIIKVSILEHDPLLLTSTVVYNKRVDSIYNKTGTQITQTATYLLAYDGNGVLVSESLL